MLLYGDLVPWYRLLDPVEGHVDEAECYRAAFERAGASAPATLLELGAGAGNNAFYLKRSFRSTLTDVSEPMLELSRELNPDCEHLLADMRSLRLDRSFDVVLVHDAVMYMTSEAELRAAMHTAFAHTRPGGAAIFAPDCVRETFHEYSTLHAGEQGTLALRALEWNWDPDPTDTSIAVEYAFLLRDGAGVSAVHDRHVEGLFPRRTWLELLRSLGYAVETIERPIGDGMVDEMFLCRRPL